MIQTNSLSYRYHSAEPLVFPDFGVKFGKALLICGESGCGKTTVLHLLAGLRPPASGYITIGDDKITDFSSAKMDQFRGRHIGIVYQQPYFIQSLSILDNLLLSPYSSNKEMSKIVAERLQVSELLSRRPNQLSVGQLQRLSIARAVMNKPKLLLVDEPTSALDNKNCRNVINLLQEEAANNDTALIIVTHDQRIRTEIRDCLDLNEINVK